ncbi:MAG: hypothetical protein JST12_17180 [Armatimonadetes bacterium]|nr:hypothetical protein [Armatimonadota bacterium]MBS1727483.1 hypothetical protein [Armatimonadota bacterium]
MASAYTPGLTVSGDIVVRRTRRLPIKGNVLVKVGDSVEPKTAVAQAMLPGALQTVKIADQLGVEAKDVPAFLKINVGDPVEKGQLVAEGKKLFGLFKAPTATCDYTGTFESFSEVTGNALIREPSIPIEIDAYIKGTVVDVMPDEGAIVETRCAMIQGIFGVGGERQGVVRLAVTDHEKVLDEGDIKPDDKGKILVGGAGMTAAAIKKAASVGAAGIIAGGLKDSDLIEFLGYDIGVAITGTEKIDLTLMVTEGFGFLPMAQRTFDLLKSINGHDASINGATQIRAGVIRPELIVPEPKHAGEAPAEAKALALEIGSQIRIIREPYFGLIGSVTQLPAELVTLESGTHVRVLRAKLGSGEEVTVPRANVEIIAAGS